MSRAALAGFVLLFASAAALAQPTAAKRKRAGELATESAKHYKRGEFEVSVALLRQAYALFPEPNLLYNLARSLEGMADKRGAVDAYKRYLANAKRIEDRGALERRIKLLERELGDQAPSQPDADTTKPDFNKNKPNTDKTKPTTKPDANAKHVTIGTTAPLAEPTFEPSRPVDRDEPIGTSAPLADPFTPLPPEKVTPASKLPLLVIGVGAGTIGVGVVFGLRALDFEKSARQEMVGLDASKDHADAVRTARLANIMYVAGGVVLAAGIIWEIFELRGQSKKSDTVTLRPLASGRGVALEWTLP